MDEGYQFIHLSDIHFGQGIHGHSPLYKDIRNEVLRDCKDMANEIGPTNAIIITGDIAFSGKDIEYDTARAWLNDLCRAVGCPEEYIFVIPGNHDADWENLKADTQTIHRFIRAVSPNEIEDHLAQYQSDGRTSNTLLEQLEAYRLFARPYGCDFKSLNEPYWTYDVLKFNSKTLRLIGLNSALFSDSEDTEDNLILGRSQYINGFKREDDVEYIALLHHPLFCFRDKDAASKYLQSRARIILHGHTHEFTAKCIDHESRFKQIESCSGAVTPLDGNYEYHYDWFNISIVEHDDLLRLEVKVYPRVWSSTNTIFTIHNVVNGNFIPFSIDLPKSRETPARVDIGVATPDLGSPIVSPPDRTEDTTPQAIDNPLNEDSFRRLQLIFWQKLDETQRKQILIELNIIPDVNKELTQTLERHALNAAKRLNKLSSLWDAVMTHIPKEQQEPNPFKEIKKGE